MATVSNDNYRYTYTMVTNPTNVVVTFTKIEYYMTYTGKWRINANTQTIGYYDQSGSYATTTISHSTIEGSGAGWKTLWTGTKVVTSYRQTVVTNVSTTAGTIEVPILPSYPITYNTDGGSEPPDTQNKYLGKTLYLAPNTPTKTGYTYVNWLCSADNNYYLPRNAYVLDEEATMTAQWTANTYIIKYNTNGGFGVVNSQEKTYNVPLNFNNGSTIYKRDIANQITRGYELLRWNTNPDDSGTSYGLGSAIPNIISDLNVYAIWELKYLYPFIGNLQTYRTATSSISDKTRSDTGKYIYISFDFIGCSDNAGSAYRLPNCKIQIDEDVYTPSLSFTTSPNGTVEFKASTQYGLDNPHNITIELSDPLHSNIKTSSYDYITTGIYPIDLFDNGQLNEVYMGLMHPYINGIPLTLTDTYVDGNIDIKLDIDPNASSVTPAVSGEDKDLFNKIVDNGWYNDVISNNNKLLLKKWADKVSDVQQPGPSPTPTYYNEVIVDYVAQNDNTIQTTSFRDVITNALEYIVLNYPNLEFTVFKGRFRRLYYNSTSVANGWYEIMIENTGDLDPVSGIPMQFYGIAMHTSIPYTIFKKTTGGVIGVNVANLTGITMTTPTGFTFQSGFTYYATDGVEAPYAMRRGTVVTLSGAFKTTAAQSGGGKKHMATLASTYWPYREMHFLQQGSGVNRWLLYIGTDGKMYADRYGTTSEIAIPNNAWLNISCSYMTGTAGTDF